MPGNNLPLRRAVRQSYELCGNSGDYLKLLKVRHQIKNSAASKGFFNIVGQVMSERYGMFLTFQLMASHLILSCAHWNASGTVIYSEKCIWAILNAAFYWRIDLDLHCRLLRELTVRINSHWNVVCRMKLVRICPWETDPRTEPFFKVSDEMGWYSMAWHGMAWHGTARQGMVWYGMVCSLHNAINTMSLLVFQTRVCHSNHSVTSHFTHLAQNIIKFSF